MTAYGQWLGPNTIRVLAILKAGSREEPSVRSFSINNNHSHGLDKAPVLCEPLMFGKLSIHLEFDEKLQFCWPQTLLQLVLITWEVYFLINILFGRCKTVTCLSMGKVAILVK